MLSSSAQDLRAITLDSSFTHGASQNYDIAGGFILTIHDVNNDQSFNKDIFVYTSNGLDFRLIENDKGSSLLINYDQTGGNSYDEIATVRNTSSQITNVVTTLDGGALVSTFFDVDMVQPWASSTTGQNALGVTDYNDLTFDDGTRQFTDFDQDNNIVWTTAVRSFDANGDVLFRRVNFDENNSVSRFEVTFEDFDNSQVWTQKIDSYTDGVTRDFVNFLNDDGTRQTLDFDQNNDQAFSVFSVFYNVNNNATFQNTVYDDGVRITKSFDAESDFAWTEIVDFYDLSGALDVKSRLNDDGTRVVTNFDQNDDFAWSQNITTFDASGNIISDVFI